MNKATLYIIVPCYNEEKVLPITYKVFLSKLKYLIEIEKISYLSKILFVNDGSKDKTWDIIKRLSKENKEIIGISQSRNRGHQNTLIAGIAESINMCDISITIDCDGQDDINAVDEMIGCFYNGADIVYGVRSNRDTDSFFKKKTAETFYKLLYKLGAEVVFNHADYRLLSKRAMKGLLEFKEVNLYLRGIVPLIGYKTEKVYYKRKERIAGETHYPLRKMLALAVEGITSLSIKPIRLVTLLGFIFAFFSFFSIFYIILKKMFGQTVVGWASISLILCFFSGIQLICLGILGEYIGKIYLETKKRPRYLISKRTYDKKEI